MFAKRALALRWALPAFDLTSDHHQSNPLVPIVAPDPHHEPCYEEEDCEDEEFNYDDWSHAPPELIEQYVRAYNEEIETYEIELYCADNPCSRVTLRQKIRACIDLRDDLIVEHTRFYPERAHLLELARRRRTIQDPHSVRRAYEESAAHHPAEGHPYRDEGARSPRTRRPSATANTQHPTKRRKKRKASPISLKVHCGRNSFECRFTERH